MRRLDNGLCIDLRRIETAFFHVTQIFKVALGSLDGRIIYAHERHSDARGKSEDTLDDRKMDGFVTYNTLFADLIFSGLELRFYKAHELGAFFQKRTHCRKHEFYRDK